MAAQTMEQVFAELHVLDDDAVGVVFLHKIEDVALARDDVLGSHGARALVAPHIVIGDGLQNVLALLERDLLAAGHRAEAVAVGHDETAGHLAHFRELGVVDLTAGNEHTRPVARLRVRLARAQLLQRLAQVGQDEILRAQICEHTFCFYYELGMYMLNRRMFQRGKDNNFFWFHEQSNIFST